MAIPYLAYFVDGRANIADRKISLTLKNLGFLFHKMVLTNRQKAQKGQWILLNTSPCFAPTVDWLRTLKHPEFRTPSDGTMNWRPSVGNSAGLHVQVLVIRQVYFLGKILISIAPACELGVINAEYCKNLLGTIIISSIWSHSTYTSRRAKAEQILIDSWGCKVRNAYWYRNCNRNFIIHWLCHLRAKRTLTSDWHGMR